MSIQALIEAARKIDSLTDEELADRAKTMSKRMDEHERELIERHRCASCGADTINYSHSFTCPWRGTGF